MGKTTLASFSACKQKTAFSLVEVLLVLLVIGIIAALTIPTMLNKSKEQGFRSAFLKTYNTIQSAFAQSIQDSNPFWDASTDDSTMNPTYYKNTPEKIKDYFKVEYGPEASPNGAGNTALGYFYRGSKNSEDINNIVKGLNGTLLKSSDTGALMNGSNALAFQVTDGTIIAFYQTNNQPWMVYIDVNGAQLPNVVGKDIFLLQAIPPSKTSASQYSILPFGAPGTGTTTQIEAKSTIENSCYSNDSGTTCAYEIIKNKNYEIDEK